MSWPLREDFTIVLESRQNDGPAHFLLAREHNADLYDRVARGDGPSFIQKGDRVFARGLPDFDHYREVKASDVIVLAK